MDSLLSKAGGFLMQRRATTEWNSFNDDVTSLSKSASESTSRLINKLRGKAQLLITELLAKHGLPRGLFPKDVTGYTFDEATSRLEVTLGSCREVHYPDKSVVRFDSTISGILEERSLTVIEGMKTKMLLWMKVTAISADYPPPDQVYFQASVKKARKFPAYDTVREGAIPAPQQLAAICASSLRNAFAAVPSAATRGSGDAGAAATAMDA
eukprot:SM000073S21460  [mRNA]  locus=s73:389915:394115:- [translate_table: standard]